MVYGAMGLELDVAQEIGNIPLLRAHVINLFFEDTCVRVIWL
jgi:hypothetical protein